jgi:uncharacterized protein (DUF427 family)
MVKARWNNQLIAESDDTVVVEGNHYFPSDSVRPDCLRKSKTTSVCGWKGTASYYDVVADGQVNADAAWYYPSPKDEAQHVAGRIAFWKGVEVSDE